MLQGNSGTTDPAGASLQERVLRSMQEHVIGQVLVSWAAPVKSHHYIVSFVPQCTSYDQALQKHTSCVQGLQALVAYFS